MSIAYRQAAVSVVGITATATSGMFVHDRVTAAICITVGALSLCAMGVSLWMAARSVRRMP